MKLILVYLLCITLLPTSAMADEEREPESDVIDRIVKQIMDLKEEGPAVKAERAELQERLKDHPDDPQLNFEYAQLNFRTGSVETAAIHLDKALAAKPEKREYLIYRVHIHLNMNEYHIALDISQKMAEREPRNPWWHNMMAKALMGLGEIDAAIESSLTAAELSPDDRIIRKDYIHMLMDASRYDDAIPFIKQTKELDPDFPWLDHHLFKAMKRSGRHQPALDLALKFAEESPEEYYYWQEIAMLYDRMSKPEKAETARERIYELGEKGLASRFIRENGRWESLSVTVIETIPNPDGSFFSKYDFNFRQDDGEWDGAHAELFSANAVGHPGEPDGLNQGDQYYGIGFSHARQHANLKLFTDEPSYDEVRQILIEFLEGKRELNAED